MGEATIRALGPEDAEAFRDLRLHGLRTEPKGFGAAYEEEAERDLAFFRARLLRGHGSRTFGAFAESWMVGTAGALFNDSLKERHKATLVGVYVRPEARGRGLARALVAEVIAHARPRAMTLLAVTGADNAAALALYRNLGFVAYGREPRALRIGDGYFDDELLMLDLRSGG